MGGDENAGMRTQQGLDGDQCEDGEEGSPVWVPGRMVLSSDTGMRI